MAIDKTTPPQRHHTTYPINGTTALVTGANRGIGRALVDALLRAAPPRSTRRRATSTR